MIGMRKAITWHEAYCRGIVSTPPPNSHQDWAGSRDAKLVFVNDDGVFEEVPLDPAEAKAEAAMFARRRQVMAATELRVARQKARMRTVGQG